MRVLALLLALTPGAFAQAEDRDLDNDGRWDFGRGGSDRDVDNDGRWDYDKGGTDRDLDNDGRWDGRIARPPGNLYAAATSQLQPILAHRDVTQ